MRKGKVNDNKKRTVSRTTGVHHGIERNRHQHRTKPGKCPERVDGQHQGYPISLSGNKAHAENTDIMEKRYRKLGGTIKVIRCPDAGHRPHGLDDSSKVVRFILKHNR